nr:Transposase, Ptta/En/Spm, plant [Ipomoea batatas]
MYNRLDASGYVSSEFKMGVEEFLDFAFNHSKYVFDDTIRCPCVLCANREFHNRDVVVYHLYSKGFIEGYWNWSSHGETFDQYNDRGEVHRNRDDNINAYQSMVIDGVFPNFGLNENERDNDTSLGELPNPSAREFFSLLNDADEALWDGCKKHSKLSAVSQLLNYGFCPFGPRVHPYNGLVEVNHKSRLASNEPFVLAQQAQQVYYSCYPCTRLNRRNWWAVYKVKPRNRYDGISNIDYENEDVNESVYQEDQMIPTIIAPSDELDVECTLDGGKMVTRGRGRKNKTQVRESSSRFAQGVDDDLTSNPSHFVNRHGLQSIPLNASLTEGQQSNAPPHVSPLSSGSQSNVRPDHVASISDGLQSGAPLLNTPLDDHVEEAIEDTVQSLHESATTLTKQTKRRGPNRGRALPSDPSKKIKLNVISGSDFLEDGVAADISAMVKSNFNDHWPTWAQFSDETKAALWAKFQGFRDAISRGRKNACTKAGINPYDSNANWEKVKEHRESWIPQPIWNHFVDNIWSKEEWMKKSAKAAKNRNTLKEGSVTKHTAGSCSFVKHKHKMEKYDTALKEKHGNDSSSQVMFDADAWKCAIGDINRSHLYGFGALEDRRSILGGSSTQRSTTTNVPNVANEALQELFKKWLSEQLPGMLSSLGYHPMDNAFGDNVPPSSSGDIPNTSQNGSQGMESNRGGDGHDDRDGDEHDELEAP